MHFARTLAAVSILLSGCAPAQRARPRDGGRLVVLLVIDQLRFADLLAIEGEVGPRGFATLGAPWPARYDAAATETAAGHATLATGAYANDHGIVGNWLFDGVRARTAIEDARCVPWGGGDGRSASTLLVPTVGDELKMATLGRARVAAIGGKDRSALLLGGPSADIALYWDIERGHMTSTSCYAPAPPPWVAELRRKQDLSRWSQAQWTARRSMEVLQRYGAVQPPGAIPAYGLGPAFPHPVGQGDRGTRFYKALRATPFGTTILLEAARAAAGALALGKRDTADLLTVSLSTVDYMGHAYGAHSVERFEALLDAHDQLSSFVGELRAALGDRVSFVLSSDHGVPPLGAQAQALRVPGGTVSQNQLHARIDAAVRAEFGAHPAGSWVIDLDSPWIALRRRQDVPLDRIVDAAVKQLRSEPWIARVLTRKDVEQQPHGAPERHSFHPDRSGDVLIVPRPGWTFPADGDALEHRGPWNESALVPLLVDAPGFELRPALRGATLRATHVAPTLARLLGIAPPAAALDDAVVVRE